MNASTGKWILAAGLALWLCACGAANRRPAQPDAPKAEDSKPAVYYAGQDGMPLYTEASFRGDPLARLPLNEKLLRTRQQGGFAFVTVERTGQTGWVENARLIWKKKAPPAKAPVEPPAKTRPDETPPPAGAAGSEKTPSDKPDASIFDSN
ncbi:MAG: hypothetical protein GY859_41390 [Desulfobacterales bacterium]|nr:hypothetical protein [Desulfobacterales bacterium]